MKCTDIHLGCCCKIHTGQCGKCCSEPETFIATNEESFFLKMLSEIPFLPVAQFLLTCSHSRHVWSIALSPVFLTDGFDSIETIRKTSITLKSLEQRGIITLDYDLPMSNYNYSLFNESKAFKYFQEVVAEGRERPDFIFDTPAIKYGSLALTGFGQDILDFQNFTPSQLLF